jgi:hypothetical protein
MKKSELTKLTKEILQEIKVLTPLNKRKAFEDMLKLSEDMLYLLIQFDELEEFTDEYGYDSLEDLLINNFGINNPQPYITVITNYYNAIKPGDIIIIESKITSIASYRNAITLTRNSGERCLDEISIALKF